MERVSKEFYVLSRMHEAGMVNEERSASTQTIAEMTNIEISAMETILKTLEQRQLISKTTAEGTTKFYVSSLGIIMASAIYT
jgi:DNA-binding MarR family transcriptional regulator